MNIYKEATKKHIRFNVGRLTNLTVEDVWNLPLTGNGGTNLDALAIALNDQLKDDAPKSFVGDTRVSATAKDAQLKFDIVLDIIKTKQDEIKQATEAAVKSATIQQLRELKAKKNLEKFNDMSIEEIDEQLAELEGK
jgi:hypothetical protein